MKALISIVIALSMLVCGCPKKEVQKDDAKPPENAVTEPKASEVKPAEVKSIDASTPSPEEKPQ